MSHFSRISTKVKNRACLVKALADLGFAGKVEVHDEPVNLYGYQNDRRQDLANVVIRRQHVGGASNDLGFVLREDGTYEAIISDYDSSQYNTQWLDKLHQRYALHVVEETVKNESYYVQETTQDVEGNIWVTIETGD